MNIEGKEVFKIDDFLIRIIPEGFSGGVGGMTGAKTATQKSGGIGAEGFGVQIQGAFGAVLKGLGIASGIGLIVGVVSGMKSLLGIITSILKLVSALLRPVERVIATLLMPILFIIKPFVILVNQVMSPFIKLAMTMMREGQQALKGGDTARAGGLFAGAGAVALQGLSAVVVAVAAEVVKLAVDSLFSGLSILLNVILSLSQMITTAIVGLFGGSTEQIDLWFETVRTNINTGLTTSKDLLKSLIDTVAGNAVIAIATTSVFLAESLGVNTEKFREDAKLMIMNTFVGAKGLSESWDLAIGTAQGFGQLANSAINTTTGEISGTFGTKMSEFQTSGTKAVRGAVDAINKIWNDLSLESKSGGGSSGGLWSAAKGFIKGVQNSFLGT